MLEGWETPRQIAQTELFTQPRDRMLVYAGVSVDELDRWRARGWISFDVRELPGIDTARVAEICFVRNLVRSGLSDLQIENLSGELDRPYLYDPARTAYSFVFGWVQLPPLPAESDIDDFIEHHLDGWTRRKVLLHEDDLLSIVAWKVMQAATAAGEADGGEAEVDS